MRAVGKLALGAAFLIGLPITIAFVSDAHAAGTYCQISALGTAEKNAAAAGIMLDKDQTSDARTIVGVVQADHLPQRAAAIALMTAMQESGLRNLPNGDRDSIGLFQQRPSQGWGTPDQLHDPIYATNAFLNGANGIPGLVDIPGWQTMPMDQAAQMVQLSAYPAAYSQWEPFANQLAAALTGGNSTQNGVVCSDNTPAEYNGPAAAGAINRALSQIGVPYSWGGGTPAGPSYGIDQGATIDGFDCSSLVQYAWWPWVKLPRTTTEQYVSGTQIPLSQAEPGDLVFFSYTGPIDHVAMLIGPETIIEAPKTGETVRIRHLDPNEPGLLQTAVRVNASGGN